MHLQYHIGNGQIIEYHDIKGMFFLKSGMVQIVHFNKNITLLEIEHICIVHEREDFN